MTQPVILTRHTVTDDATEAIPTRFIVTARCMHHTGLFMTTPAAAQAQYVLIVDAAIIAHRPNDGAIDSPWMIAMSDCCLYMGPDAAPLLQQHALDRPVQASVIEHIVKV